MFKHDLGSGADLRILELHHAEALLQLVADNRAYFGAWLGWANSMATVEDAQRFIKRGLSRFAEDGLPSLGIWLHGSMVGGTLFFPRDTRIQSTEIGYWLAEHATGSGLMTRSLRAILGYAFGDLRLNRVGLQAEVMNTQSRAVAERLSFTFEGIRRQGWVNGSALVDMAIYAMLASDWAAIQAAAANA